MRLKSICIGAVIFYFLVYLCNPVTVFAIKLKKQQIKPPHSGLSFMLGGRYIGAALYAENQGQGFQNVSGYPNNNSFQEFAQMLRVNTLIKYKKLISLYTQFALSSDYNGIANYYGGIPPGFQTLAQNPVPVGFNNDFDTFGIREVYINLRLPNQYFRHIIFGRTFLHFGLGVAIRTDVDGIFDNFNVGNFNITAGTMITSMAAAGTYCYSSNKLNPCNTLQGLAGTTEGFYPTSAMGYTHVQMGTIPVIQFITKKPVRHTIFSAWFSEAHLNQFQAPLYNVPNSVYFQTFGSYTDDNNFWPTLNITLAGGSLWYENGKNKLAIEFDYLRGKAMPTSAALSDGLLNSRSANHYLWTQWGGANPNSPLTAPLLVEPAGNNAYDTINSYDIYAKGSTLTSIKKMPLMIGFKFGLGAPVEAGSYDMSDYSRVQNQPTLFGNLITSNWQMIQILAPGNSYMYGAPLSSNLENKRIEEILFREFLPDKNNLTEAVIQANWVKSNIHVNGKYVPLFGGSNIGTEFDLDFVHVIKKGFFWKAWASYMFTGRGLETFYGPGNYSSGCVTSASTACLDTATHKNIAAVGTAIVWNF